MIANFFLSFSLAMITKRLKYSFLALLSFSVIIFVLKYQINSNFLNLETPVSKRLHLGRFLLENILRDEQKILKSNGNQVFFIETHLDEFRELKNARQACSVESAGKN